ncbi:multicopper oxidase domain-containing protein [Gephyromycinifex aptenodytis]|uniref:multicopper oxidase domain-containing protein n=1 Tax=Gephyromycinifex aptenodytis TaxID=2716227 RepID=UPI001D02AB6C|nr:multicopper oxidase domain-containing protein [Gephyromycinifex aptenodytis]
MPSPSQTTRLQNRASAPPRAWWWRNTPTFIWLGVAVVLTLIHPFLPRANWLMTHTVLLGALSHAAMVWSTHFTQALLKTGPHLDPRSSQNKRLALLHIGVILVLIGVPIGRWQVAVVGAACVIGAASWQIIHLTRRLRAALPGRFHGCVHYYVAAASCLVLGVGVGGLLATGPPAPWPPRLLAAHISLNIFGWIGLTLIGTLVTFWPTLLRTRISPQAEAGAARCLPLFLGSITVVVTGALVGHPSIALIGVLAYAFTLLLWGRSLLPPLRTRPPREFAPWSVGAALCWLFIVLTWVIVLLMSQGGRERLAAGHGALVAVAVTGFTAQLLIGALSYLIPAIGGGGPAVVRAAQAPMERAGTLRVVTLNLGLALCLLPLPSVVRVVVSFLAYAALLSFLPLAWASRRAAAKALRDKAATTSTKLPGTGSRAGEHAPHRPGWSGVQAVTAVAALALAIAATLAVGDSGIGAGSPQPAAAQAEGTGQTTRVQVAMTADMRFVPDRVRVPAGNALVIELTNTDDSTAHDLVLDTGQRTQRIAPRGQGSLDVGVVTTGIQGWCSIVGHRQMGMTFSIDVEGAAPGSPAADPSAGAAPGHQGHAGGGGLIAGPSAADDLDPMRKPSADFVARDASLPALPPRGAARTHKVTLRVQELELEVAPGVRQKRWTFNGAVPGPTLHGRVGDIFEVTLINDGSMGHSVDFHAGDIAPDEPMRTIPSGESLVYRFTAKRSGIWMYHCSTTPMSSHIAAGMHGAVVIEPDDLPVVDRSYVFVQSEVYLGAQRSTPTRSPRKLRTRWSSTATQTNTTTGR